MGQGADIDRLYREGVAAIRAGDKAAARERLMEVVRLDRTHEQAWLWLSASVDSAEDRVVCLENVLTINPSNEAARRGLEKLGRPAPSAAPTPSVPVEPTLSYSAPPQPESPPAPPKEETPILEHGQSRIAEMMSHPREKKRKDEDSWRQSLYDPAATTGATSARFIKDEPVVNRSLSDLFNTWAAMLIFNTGELRLEAKYGSFWHTVINVAGASLIQAIGTTIFWAVLITLLQAGNQPPLLQSFHEVLLRGGQETAELVNAWPRVLQQLNAGVLPAVIESFVGAMISIPFVFVWQLIRSWVIDFVAHQLGGKGDVIQTLHAVTVGLVVAAIAMLPVMFVLPFVPWNVAFFVLLAVSLYPFVVQAVGVGEVHKFGVLPALGALIISGFLTVGLIACCFFLIAFLAAGGRGG